MFANILKATQMRVVGNWTVKTWNQENPTNDENNSRLCVSKKPTDLYTKKQDQLKRAKFHFVWETKRKEVLKSWPNWIFFCGLVLGLHKLGIFPNKI